MRIMFPLAVVLALVVFAFLGWRVEALNLFVAAIVPYAAVATFIAGFVWRVLYWARTPVPFKIPTTCGQQESLDWIENNKLESPPNKFWVVMRMALEVFAFRSLFRGTSTKVEEGPRLTYNSSKWLWAAGLMFHWSFLIIFLRHFRLFVEPVPSFVKHLEGMDGFMQITLPTFYITDAVLVLAVTYLFIRRVVLPEIKYISLPADYFPLFLVLGIGISGITMRYLLKSDIAGVKEMIQGLVHFSPVVAKGANSMFYIHITLVSALMAYFPFSKLMHLGGVFLSPTRNMANDTRQKRHINPWNPDIKFHTYMEYEDDFRDVMKSVDLPLEQEPEEEKDKGE